MTPRRIIKTALLSLKRHKLRALLTTLGIIIGVVSIIAVMSISAGAKVKVNEQIDRLGTNFIIVLGGAAKHKFAGQSRTGIAAPTLKMKDVEDIIEECDDVYEVSAGVQLSGVATYEGNNWRTMIGGCYANYLAIREWPLHAGEFFTEQDDRAANKVCTLGWTVAKELFGKLDPVGKTIRVNRMPFRVLGVLTEKGKLPNGQDQDDMVFAPFKTVQRKIMGTRFVQAIIMSGKSKERLHMAAQQVRAVLRQNHQLSPGEEDDFTLFTQDDAAQASEAASYVLNLLLLIVASIALVVGGVGIMNIMLVTVTERTREIGIRMALGANATHILSQFLLESIVICLVGGLIGLTLGVSLSTVVGLWLAWPIHISSFSIVLSLASSILVGVSFGLYPAYKASQLNPVDALADRG